MMFALSKCFERAVLAAMLEALVTLAQGVRADG
jgi:hypothetical protein